MSRRLSFSLLASFAPSFPFLAWRKKSTGLTRAHANQRGTAAQGRSERCGGRFRCLACCGYGCPKEKRTYGHAGLFAVRLSPLFYYYYGFLFLWGGGIGAPLSEARRSGCLFGVPFFLTAYPSPLQRWKNFAMEHLGMGRTRGALASHERACGEGCDQIR